MTIRAEAGRKRVKDCYREAPEWCHQILPAHRRFGLLELHSCNCTQLPLHPNGTKSFHYITSIPSCWPAGRSPPLVLVSVQTRKHGVQIQSWSSRIPPRTNTDNENAENTLPISNIGRSRLSDLPENF